MATSSDPQPHLLSVSNANTSSNAFLWVLAGNRLRARRRALRAPRLTDWGNQLFSQFGKG